MTMLDADFDLKCLVWLIWLRRTQLCHTRNRGQKAHMAHMARMAQADSTFSEFATAPRLRGFHSVNRGVLLALPAVDQSY